MKKLIAMLLALTCLAALCACGATTEEVPVETTCAHTFEGPSCESAKICSQCGVTEGNPLRHNWMPANCENPRTCVRCGMIDETAPLHNWKEATCEKAKNCVRCYITEGEALGHTMENDTCTTCGKTAAELQG